MVDADSIDWRIESGRVGPIALGAALPAALLKRDLGERYVARYIADAQPVDGFQFVDPPVLVLVDGGPFAAHASQSEEASESPTDALREQGAEAARQGARVSWIMVTGPGPATADGLGVGSTFDAIEAAHPDARLSPRPPTLGNDTCMARMKELPGVGFVFASCKKARAGDPAVRIELWPL